MSVSLVNGFFLGIVYSLFAVGIVLVYRVDRVVNFAHGSIGMIGTFLFMTLWTDNDYPLFLAIAIGCAVSALIGAVVSYLVVRPLRGQRPEVPTLATFGVSALLLIYAGRHWGINPIPNPPILKGQAFVIFDVNVQKIQVVTAIVAVVLLGLLLVLLHRSRFGLRVRAVALNPGAAAQVGVRTERVSISIWALAGFLAALSGILISSRGSLKYDFMTSFMLRGLVVALLGGLTNVGGAFAAGMFVGLAEGYIGYKYSSPGSQEAFLAIAIIVLLMIRPTGLFRAQY